MILKMKSIYNNSFYEEQSPFSVKSAQKIVPYISNLLPCITSVIDIGCGVGAWLYEWKREGKNVLGIDGNDLDKKYRKIDSSEYLKHNLNQPFPNMQKKYDLCMSLEVAEHLSPKSAEFFINDLCSYSDIILFSAAIPGQTGVNHINEQWPQYWANIFFSNGFKAYDILRDYFWNDTDVAWWYAQNMILYMNINTSVNLNITCNEQVLSRVHPKCFLMYYKTQSLNKQDLSYKQKIKSKIKKILRL